ncbi:MAG: A/G-specific adenine glycosylase [Acidobacteriia bacterium]|nr:A/G-specific adenine glycosylase [Terriglobia bacterium]
MWDAEREILQVVNTSATDDNIVLHGDVLPRDDRQSFYSNAAVRAIRRRLLGWYERARRDLPWRRTGDPYRIWVSEIMLQQTRVAAVVPYYERFLTRFPDVSSLAEAREEEVLTLWAGLGYYSRARNLQRAARQVRALGGFPETYEEIRELAGVGDYTAAAVASIAFGEARAAVDGNVLRVMSRLMGDGGDIGAGVTRARLGAAAGKLLDPENASEFNQAMMELGATVCLPREPLCGECPVSLYCRGLELGRQRELPVKLRRREKVEETQVLLVIRRGGCVLLGKRGESETRLAGFWELPEAGQLPQARRVGKLGTFRHTITFHHYSIEVEEGVLGRAPRGWRWVKEGGLGDIPLSTTARKALDLIRGAAKL